ncbi:hypothetical protein CISIN_1g042525mg, partial [Citrus sinensis]
TQEFRIFFNDHTSNDFNTLFKSLPPERNYFAASVPGAFYGALISQGIIASVNSSHSVRWLSSVPNEVE